MNETQKEELYKAAQSIFSTAESGKVPMNDALERLMDAVNDARGDSPQEINETFKDRWLKTYYEDTDGEMMSFHFKLNDAEREASWWMKTQQRKGYLVSGVEREKTQDHHGNPITIVAVYAWHTPAGARAARIEEE